MSYFCNNGVLHLPKVDVYYAGSSYLDCINDRKATFNIRRLGAFQGRSIWHS